MKAATCLLAAVVVSGAAAAALAAPRPAARRAPGVYLEASLIVGDRARGGQRERIIKLWKVGSLSRMDQERPQGPEIRLTNRQGVFLLESQYHEAIKLPPKAAKRPGALYSFKLAEAFRPATDLRLAHRIGAQQVLGVTCDIWEGELPGIPGAAGANTIKVWLPHSRQPDFPLRAEANADRNNGIKGKLTVTRILYTAIPLDRFQVPRGWKIRVAGTGLG